MASSTKSSKLDRKRRGATSVEFVLVAAFYFVPMIVGTLVMGFNLVRAMQAIQITRDVAHMYAKGVDFSQQANQDLVVNLLGPALNLQGNGGNVTGGTNGDGVIILSTITYIGSGQCTSCANLNHYVVTRRIVIGNKNQLTSSYGKGKSMTIAAASGDVQNYATDVNARADSFSRVLTLDGGDMAFLTESYFAEPGLAIPGLISSTGAYNYAAF